MDSTLMKQLDSLNMHLEENRLKTFNNWKFPDNKPCNSQKLAEAGFYYLGMDDMVQCFLCFKELQDWEEDDDPWVEHKSHSKCSFAKLGLPEEKLTLQQLFQFKIEQIENLHLHIDGCISQHTDAIIKELQSLKRKTTKILKKHKQLY